MSSDEKGISPAHKTSTPTHRSASSSTSSQRDSRQMSQTENTCQVHSGDWLSFLTRHYIDSK